MKNDGVCFIMGETTTTDVESLSEEALEKGLGKAELQILNRLFPDPGCMKEVLSLWVRNAPEKTKPELKKIDVSGLPWWFFESGVY